MRGAIAALAIALLISMLVIARLTRYQGALAVAAKTTPAAVRDFLTGGSPVSRAPRRTHTPTAMSALATRQSNPSPGSGHGNHITQPPAAAAATIAPVTRARSSSAITYGGIV